jgi:CRISPR-associated exonuclease Cas4
MYSQDDLLPISALQHMVFCERQAALIHIEGLWEENVLTVEGERMHERVHEQDAETLHDVRTVRGLRIRSLRLGLVGVADLVEFRLNSSGVALTGLTGLWMPSITEYKHGKPKIDRSDEVQLCAQAICIEEMLSVSIPESSFFYGKPRRRQVVSLDDSLHHETEEIAGRLHALIDSRKTPPPEYSRRCRQCSLVDLCLPKATGARNKVGKYLSQTISACLTPDNADGGKD